MYKTCYFESLAFKKKCHCLAIVALLALLLIVSSFCAASSAEDEIKAAFVLNFVRFVQWPDSYPQSGELMVCHPDIEPLSGKLLLLDGRLAGRRKIKISHCPDLLSNNFEVVFFGENSEHEIEELLAQLKGLPVLTVSDIPEFVDRGGMIGLVIDHNKLSFEINLLVANESGLRLSSQLLNLARKVIK